MSMLKYHPPYLSESSPSGQISNTPALRRYVEGIGALGKFKGTIDDLVLASKLFDFDYVEYCRNPTPDKYPYFPGKIYLQPWQPVSSSETRLWVARSDIDKKIDYSSREWENKFYWYKWYRAYVYHSEFAGAEGNPEADKPELVTKSYCVSLVDELRRDDHYYDGCADCCLELSILRDVARVCGEHDTEPLRVSKLATLIDKYSGYSLAHMSKTLWHGYLLKSPKWIRLYYIVDGRAVYYQYNGKKVLIKETNILDDVPKREIMVPYEGFRVDNDNFVTWKQLYVQYIRSYATAKSPHSSPRSRQSPRSSRSPRSPRSDGSRSPRGKDEI